jgi:GT2 family glycosyltransferase
MMSVPKISVLVTAAGDRPSLRECLSSLRAQTYPKDRFSIDVNGGVAACRGEYVALLDERVTVDPDWLATLVATAEESRAAAVSATIFESDRRTVYFGGRDLSFVGFPTGAMNRDQLIYPCRDSVLLHRQVLMDAGGFDESFDGCLADVDFGWRLNVLGHVVSISREARAYRGGGTTLPPGDIRRGRLVERNALAMILKNYEERSLARVFPAAVALSLFRGLTHSGIDSLSLDLATKPAEFVQVSSRLIAHLIALEDFGCQLASLQKQRDVIQEKRRRADAEVLPLFGNALQLEGDTAHQELARVLIRDLGIDELFTDRGVHRTLSPKALDVSPAVLRRKPPPSPRQALPKASVIILTALGPTHLAECLRSLQLQTYPADRIEVIIVDNGSTDDPSDEAARFYPGARVILNRANLGFAGGNNVGAAAATGEYLVFLNDDTRVDADWLHEMVTTAQRHSAAAVAGFIVDWSGKRVDFVEGAVNFQGKGFQLNYDVPMDTLTLNEQPLLFGCGCALLIDRAVFDDIGGWDEGTFAYYEDVELGWRLNLLGHTVWFSPRAVVHHRHHGTSGKWPEPPRLRLYERNSLRMLYALLDRSSLQCALPAALLLAADRALLNTALSRVHDSAFAQRSAIRGGLFSTRRVLASSKTALRARGIARRIPMRSLISHLGVRGLLGVAREMLIPRRPEPGSRAGYSLAAARSPADAERFELIPITAAAALSGIFSFLSDLPDLASRRSTIQNRRLLSDTDVLKKFGSHWLQPCPSPFQSEHDAVHAGLVKYFGLADPLANGTWRGP